MTVNFSLCFLPECTQRTISSTVLLLREAQKEVAEKIILYNKFFFAERLGNEGYKKKKRWLLSCLCVDLGKPTKDFTV